MIDKNFWKGKKVFITGHTGFKGSWLTEMLLLQGANIKGYSLEPPTKPNLFDVLKIEKSIEHVIGDIRDAKKLDEEMHSFQPEFVFHLAAQPLVRLSYKEPRETYETNIMGTVNLYEALRKCESVYSVVSITTDKCYENKEWVWGYREQDPMGGYDPYSSSKGCAELVSAAYRSSFFNPDMYGKTHHIALSTARAGNVIGGGDWALDRLVPDCVRSLEKNEVITIRSPNATRPWQHVLEPLFGYLSLAQKMCEDGVLYSEAWNFGPGDDGVMNVENIVKNVIDCWGSGKYSITPDADLHEAQLLKLDPSKAKARLHWQTKWNVNEALEQSVAWYKCFIQTPNEIKAFTKKQIESYLVK